MSKNKVQAVKPKEQPPPMPPAPPPKEEKDINAIMNEIYEKVEPDSVLRNIVTSDIELITSKFSK